MTTLRHLIAARKSMHHKLKHLPKEAEHERYLCLEVQEHLEKIIAVVEDIEE